MNLQPQALDANGHPIKVGDQVSLPCRITGLGTGPLGETITVILDDGSEVTTSPRSVHYLAKFDKKVGSLTALTGIITTLQGYGMLTEAIIELHDGDAILVKKDGIQK